MFAQNKHTLDLKRPWLNVYILFVIILFNGQQYYTYKN